MEPSVKPEDSDEDGPFDTLAYVVGSKYRRMIIRELASGPATPTKIAEAHDVHVSHVSRALGELADRSAVSAHGTGSRTRLYRITDHGEAVAALLADYEEGENG